MLIENYQYLLQVIEVITFDLARVKVENDDFDDLSQILLKVATVDILNNCTLYE